MIVAYLQEFGTANRNEIDSLLFDKLSDLLSEKQKKQKIGNLLSALRIQQRIVNTGTTRYPRWELLKEN